MDIGFSIGSVYERLQGANPQADLPDEKVIVGKDQKGSELEKNESTSAAIKALTLVFDKSMEMAMLTTVTSSIGQTVNNLQRQP